MATTLGLLILIAATALIVPSTSAGASMALSRREGTSEEATSNALRVGIGCLIVGSVGTIVAALI
ncbi:hypothetical protein RAE06_09065 [Corynebacterium tuberculostearicum]|uniref:hypothetical protein n=1 Tax=Corynebacterium tuberculostearicum TaxID=38304 RepID=UPI002934CFB5|nr:hypothetical protein [Corynebacterium tuberculostearicum]MDV2429036.1 hypothetical protein [Corynebacterium tuberculostearicum]